MNLEPRLLGFQLRALVIILSGSNQQVAITIKERTFGLPVSCVLPICEGDTFQISILKLRIL